MHSSSDGTSYARSVCLIQSGIAVVCAVIFAVVSGWPKAFAALYGGVVAVLPTIYFARRAFKRQPGQNPAEMAGAVYRGEIGKIVLTALLFALGISVFAKQFPALIVTYVACLFAYWVVIARVAWSESHGAD